MKIVSFRNGTASRIIQLSNTRKMRLLIILFVLNVITLNAQNVRINEMVSSNSEYFDEDGDTPDWIELYNHGMQDVSLNEWSLSDDTTDLRKWIFPDITLVPNEYLLLWASSKDRSAVSYARTLINQGDAFKYIIPNSEPNTNWKSLNYNDSSWPEGASGFGYNDGDDATIIPNGTRSIYLRKVFTINNLDDISSIILDIDYDDGFVAYLNGVEIARANVNGVPPAFNAGTFQDHEAQMYNGGIPDRFLINDFSSIINEGENVLSIQAHNISPNSSDFTLIPFLSVVYSNANDIGTTPPDILNLASNNLHTNFKISSDAEIVSLVNDLGVVVDQLAIEHLSPNHSMGVSPVTEDIVYFTETTPGYENAISNFIGTIRNEVLFYQEGGLHNGSITLSLSGNTDGEIIRYEMGGKEPNASSPVYMTPLELSNSTSIRARMFLDDFIPSKVYTKTYIINANHDIDILLLTTEPDNLFDEDTGIYVFGPDGTFETDIPYFGANFWEDWERPIHMAFYENDSDDFSEFDAGVKIFGGWSRGQNGQRSLALYARGQYGYNEFDHAFFDQLPYDNFEALVLRNSGQDWMRSSMKDIMLTSLMRGSGLDFQEHNPVATYINGDYWGMYNMREKVNEHMLAAKHNIDAADIDLLTNNAEIIEGDNEEYIQLIEYINSTNLSSESNFTYVAERIDLKEYALYQAANIYFNNTDWPGNNIKFWKHPGGKWRWIMYDTDFGFGPFWSISNYDTNTLDFALDPYGPGWPNPPWSTLLFRKLTTNINFRNQFINRYADELNTRFLPSNVIEHIDQIYASIAPEIIAHYNRWKSDPSLTNSGINTANIQGWVAYYLNNMKQFAQNRHSIAKQHILTQFYLPNIHTLSITNPTVLGGAVEINDNLLIQETTWSGDYFETVPIKLRAKAEPGYEFSHWSGDLYSNDETITLDMLDAFEVIPNFIPATVIYPLVINEINYRSSDDFDAGDWLELYNPNTSSVDLSNWIIKDDDDSHEFIVPEGTIIESKGYMVFVRDMADFTSAYPEVTDYVGELDFGLGTSDAVRLFTNNNTLEDEVYYQSEDPWLDCANETGNTLELINPTLDNALAESWDCLNNNGSPGMVNDSVLSSNELVDKFITIYPNPAKNTLFIDGVNQSFQVLIYTSIGQLVATDANEVMIDISNLSKGLYYIQIIEDNHKEVFSFIKY